MKQNNAAAKFVTDVSSLTGVDGDAFVKNRSGYIGGIKVSGIDIFNYKKDDYENAIYSFGLALSVVDIPTKYVFVGCKPDYSNQMANLARHELTQENQFLKSLLARQRAWFEFYQKKKEIRYSFVLFFSPDKKKISDCIDKYINCLSLSKITAVPCRRKDYEQVFEILLKGGNEIDTE